MLRRYFTRGIYALLLSLVVLATHGSPLVNVQAVDVSEKEYLPDR